MSMVLVQQAYPSAQTRPAYLATLHVTSVVSFTGLDQDSMVLRHLAKRHLAKRHLAKRHLAKRHSA